MATAARKVAGELPKLPYHDHVQHTLASGARRLNIFGDVTFQTMAHVVNGLTYMQLQDAKKPVEILMNTPGGSVIDGLAIYDAIQYSNAKGTPVNITVNGACMSMGTVILQAAKERRAFTNSEFLLHEIHYGGHMSHTEHEDFKKQADRMQLRLNNILVSRSKLSPKKLEELIKRRDYTISAQEALEVGLIDTIVK